LMLEIQFVVLRDVDRYVVSIDAGPAQLSTSSSRRPDPVQCAIVLEQNGGENQSA
jgi:hypothetical protein